MNLFWEIIGTVGSILFATACVPMAWKTIRTGGDIGNPISTIWTFVGATLLFGAYLTESLGLTIPVLMLWLEFACWSTALWYHYFPRRQDESLAGLIYIAHNGVCTTDLLRECSRETRHDGPCNGLPRPSCILHQGDATVYFPNHGVMPTKPAKFH